MNRDILETQWVQIREILKDKFSNLTEEDIKQINGRYDQLVAKLQQKYGYSREEAEERIRNWNFGRFATPREQVASDDRKAFQDDRVREDTFRREKDHLALKWALGLGIPLILLASYFLSTAKTSEFTKSTPAVIQEQMITETPADRALTNSLRNTLFTRQDLASEMRNVQISSHNGVVTLSGFVSTREMRDVIGMTAQNSAGVRQVINNIQIK